MSLCCYPHNITLEKGIYNYDGENFNHCVYDSNSMYNNNILVYGYSWDSTRLVKFVSLSETPIVSVTESICYFNTKAAFTSVYGYITVTQDFSGSNSIDVYSDRLRDGNLIHVYHYIYEVANSGTTDIAINIPSSYSSYYQAGSDAFLVVNNNVVCDFSNLYIQRT